MALDIPNLNFGEINMYLTERLLKKDGAFLLRWSDGTVLSVRTGNRINHFKFSAHAKTYKIGKTLVFSSLDALLQHFYETGEQLHEKAFLKTPIYNVPDQEIDSEAETDESEGETEFDDTLGLLDKMDKMRESVDALVMTLTVEKRQQAATAVHKFLTDWRNEITTETTRQDSPIAEEPKSFWSRLFGSPFGGGGRGSGSSPKSVSMRQTSMSLPGLEDDSDSTVSESLSYSQYATMPASMSKSVFTESSVRGAPTAVEPSAMDEESEKTGPPSLHLMTCQSADCDSPAAKPTAIGNIESGVLFSSYLLQTVDDTRPVGELKSRVNGLETRYSAAAVSSCVMEEAPSTQFEARVLSDVEMFRKAIRDQILAMIGGDEDDEGGLGVEILEVAPADENDIANPIKLAGNSDRSEIESLRSTQAGLVRKRINTFNRVTS